jgi:hypothetical protein
LYSAGVAWGEYWQRATGEKLEAEISVEGGRLELARLRLPFAGAKADVRTRGRARATVRDGEAVIEWADPVRLSAGDKLRVTLG